MRYIDDLLTLNNSGFACKIDDIYPPELELKKTTECPATLSYLDLLITIDNRKYSTSVFDKRGRFDIAYTNPRHHSYFSLILKVWTSTNSNVRVFLLMN